MKKRGAKETKEKLAFYRSLALPIAVKEHQFHPVRQWRFDIAIPSIRAGFEYEGYGSGHFSYKGYTDDCEKYNAASLLGWQVYRFTAISVSRGHLDDTMRALGLL